MTTCGHGQTLGEGCKTCDPAWSRLRAVTRAELEQASAARQEGERVIAALAEALDFASEGDRIDPADLLWALNDAGWYVGRQSDEFRAGYDAGRRTTRPTKPEVSP